MKRCVVCNCVLLEDEEVLCSDCVDYALDSDNEQVDPLDGKYEP